MAFQLAFLKRFFIAFSLAIQNENIMQSTSSYKESILYIHNSIQNESNAFQCYICTVADHQQFALPQFAIEMSQRVYLQPIAEQFIMTVGHSI